MSNLKEIVGYSRRKKEIFKLNELPQSFQPLDDIYQITLVDDNDRTYVFRILNNIPEPALDPSENPIDYYENVLVDLVDIKEIFNILTDDQRNIVMHIYYLYKNNKKNHDNFDEICEDNPKIIIQGPAGTGKSTIINLIEKLITWEENKRSYAPQKIKVIKCAYTGKAATNIDGLTLNHTFSIPGYLNSKKSNDNIKYLSKKQLDSKKTLLSNCIFFICDEISMVGENTMKTVNSRLQQIFNSKKIYGNRFVLLVGDLYQLDPVKQKPLYPDSQFWTSCGFYELTKIVRQDDPKFINALNNFRDSLLTQEDINLLESRKIQDKDKDKVPDSVINLFYLNKHVDEFNDRKLNKSNAKEEMVYAIDNPMIKLRVMIGIRYMVTCNIDVGDGLANGTTGVVKDFEYDENGVYVRVIWIKFHSDLIGRKSKTNYFAKYNKRPLNDWVPIFRSKITVPLKTKPKSSQTVAMFPLRAAEAITIHKSQGQTYHEGVCINFTSDPYDKLRTDKSLQYVALTRVKRLVDLYILGSIDFSVTKSQKFTRTEETLDKLRNEKKIKLAFKTFDDKTDDVIVYLNTGLTFNEHHQFITSDKWYKNASLLIFSATNTIASDHIQIANFEIAFRSDDEIVLRSGGGIICYIDPRKSVKVVSSMSDDKNQIYLTLLFYENYLYIITGFKGDLNDNIFQLAISDFITKYVREERCIMLIGDIDNNQNKTPSLNDFLNDLNFKKELSYDVLTSDGKSQSDIVFTQKMNIPQDHIGFYEYIPSPHKPIYVILPPNYEKIGSSEENILQDLCHLTNILKI